MSEYRGVVCPPGWYQCDYLRCKRRKGPVEKDGIVCGLLKAVALPGVAGRAIGPVRDGETAPART